MANKRLEEKLAKRKNMDRSTKLGIRDNWYYTIIRPGDTIKIIRETQPLAVVLGSNFKPELKAVLKMGAQAVYLLSEPKTEKENKQPTAIYAGHNLYGTIYIVAMMETKTEISVDLLPFTNTITAIDSLWFPTDGIREIEIIF
jgi:hypothetical protein